MSGSPSAAGAVAERSGRLSRQARRALVETGAFENAKVKDAQNSATAGCTIT